MVTEILVSVPGLIWIAAILAATPFIVVTAVVFKYRYRLSGKAIAALIVIAGVIAGVIMHLAVSSNITIRIDKRSITISAPLNPGITISKDSIESVMVANPLKIGLKPTVRTLGTAMGNLLIGWFKLSNGANAYIVATNINSKAIIIKEKNGTYVIIATSKNKQIINALTSNDYKVTLPKF